MTHEPSSFFFFFFNDTATTEIYTLSLHDALPISTVARDGAVDDPIEKVLHDRTNLGVGAFTGTGAQRTFKDGADSREQLAPNHGPDRGFQPRPGGVALLADGDHIAGDEHLRNAGQLKQPLDERRPLG